MRLQCVLRSLLPVPKARLMSKYAGVHASPSGPGDARPTALDVVKDASVLGKLAGKVILITGGSSGIGTETARAAHATGADVFITTRDHAKASSVRDNILETSGGTGKLEILHLELDSLQSVRSCAAVFLQQSKKLNILINNAGVMACPESQTKEGFETHFGTNHLAHFQLFLLLKELLLQSASPQFSSRVVVLSSMGHRSSTVLFDDLDLKKGGYTPFKAYGQSKTATIWFSNEIERRFGVHHLHSTSVNPGGILTPLQRHLSAQQLESMNSVQSRLYMKSPAQGAATTMWAAVAKEWEDKGGRYLEDCSISRGHTGGLQGYAAWAYNQDDASRLWNTSIELLGME